MAGFTLADMLQGRMPPSVVQAQSPAVPYNQMAPNIRRGIEDSYNMQSDGLRLMNDYLAPLGAGGPHMGRGLQPSLGSRPPGPDNSDIGGPTTDPEELRMLHEYWRRQQQPSAPGVPTSMLPFGSKQFT